MIRLLISAVLVASVLAAGDAPRSKASDYPVHATGPGFEIGAEYLVHSIPSDTGYLFTKDYLVVEVAIFPSQIIHISSGQFSLRVNHGKSFAPDSAGAVAGAIKYPDWEQHPVLTAQAGPIVVGPPETGRFPGDQRGNPIPQPVPDPPSGLEKAPSKTVDEILTAAAMPEGRIDRPARGCLFFRFRGKTKSIRSLELEYDSGDANSKVKISLF